MNHSENDYCEIFNGVETRYGKTLITARLISDSTSAFDFGDRSIASKV